MKKVSVKDFESFVAQLDDYMFRSDDLIKSLEKKIEILESSLVVYKELGIISAEMILVLEASNQNSKFYCYMFWGGMFLLSLIMSLKNFGII